MHDRRQILVIDLLRFVAAAGVAAYHLCTASLGVLAPIRLFAPGAVLPRGGVQATWAGWVGVEIFFVISGYVIARSAKVGEPAPFLRRRLLRLAPAAWICASLTALVLLAGRAEATTTIVTQWGAAMLFVPLPTQIDPSYWTLEVELVFYLVTAFAIARAPRGSDPIAAMTRRLGAASVGFWVLVNGLGFAPHALLSTVPFYLTLLPHGAFFAMGMLLARAADAGWTRARLAGLAVLASAAAAEIVDHATMLQTLPGHHVTAVPLTLFAAATALVATAGSWQRALTRWPGPRLTIALGRLTYPLYLLHQVIGAGLVAAGLAWGLPPGMAILLAAVMVVTVAVAVSERAEPRLRRSLTRLLTPREEAPDTRRTASLRAG